MELNLTNLYNLDKTIKNILLLVGFMWEEGFSRLKKRMLLFSLFCFFDIIATAYFCKNPDYETSIIVRTIMLQYRSVQLGALIGIVWDALLPPIGVALIWVILGLWFIKKQPQYIEINRLSIEFPTILFFMASAAPHFQGGLSWIISSLSSYPWNVVSWGMGCVLYLIGELLYVHSRFDALLSLLKNVFHLNQKN